MSDGQGSASINPVGDILWKLKVPSKIKIFGWKDLHDMVPGLRFLLIDMSLYRFLCMSAAR
jgi:hypothetical protein